MCGACGNLLDALSVDNRLGNTKKGKKSGDVFGIVNDGSGAAGCGCACAEHNNKRKNHQHPLYEIGSAFGQKSAEIRIGQDKDGADEHHHMIIEAEELVKKFAHGDKAAACVDREENENKQRGDGHNYFFMFFEAIAEKFRYGNGIVGCNRISAQALGYQQPV